MPKSQRDNFLLKNYKYILQNCFIPDETAKIIEPFVGDGDLLNFLGAI